MYIIYIYTLVTLSPVSIDGIEDSLVLTFFLLVNNQQGKFFNGPSFRKLNRFLLQGKFY